MSVTAKSTLRNPKSLRPCAEPLAVNTTCRPCESTSAIHWLTALALHDDPEPSIGPCAAALAGAPVTTSTAITMTTMVHAPHRRFLTTRHLSGGPAAVL